MHALRGRFKKDIVAEFMVPKHLPRPSHRRAGKVVILCDGMPTAWGSKPILNFFAKKGYWVFHPRYRGTWESGGKFLRHSPEKDILDVIDQLPRGFRDAWSGKKYRVKPEKIYIIGSSFGGAATLLASRDKRVTRVVAISPVTDWSVRSKAEPLPWLAKVTHEAFGEGYRGAQKDWKRLGKGNFYNPMSYADKIPGSKIMMIHAKDDESISWKPSAHFAKKTGAQLWLLKRGGHMGLGLVMQLRFWKKIRVFLK
ncbi:MAG: alpha/beta fold hydrolase [bacterium]|nr:alpha/beta fold hydrolase [bacterium]